MTSVKEVVTEMSFFRDSSYPPPNLNTPAILPHNIFSPIQTLPSSQHPGDYP